MSNLFQSIPDSLDDNIMDFQQKATLYFIEKEMMYLQRSLGDVHTIYNLLALGQADFGTQKNGLIQALANIKANAESISTACKNLPGYVPWSKITRKRSSENQQCIDKRCKK